MSDIALYTRKPINVAAVKLTRENCYEVAQWIFENDVVVHVFPDKDRIIMQYDEPSTVRFGSWIMRSDARFHACSDAHFHKHYSEFEAVTNGDDD